MSIMNSNNYKVKQHTMFNKFLTETRGTGVLNRVFHSYAPFKGDITGRRSGALISTGSGKAVAYAIWKLQERGI